jgi:hypothetical protein
MEMKGVFVRIVIELLFLLSIVTKEVKRWRASELSEQDMLHVSI